MLNIRKINIFVTDLKKPQGNLWFFIKILQVIGQMFSC